MQLNTRNYNLFCFKMFLTEKFYLKKEYVLYDVLTSFPANY